MNEFSLRSHDTTEKGNRCLLGFFNEALSYFGVWRLSSFVVLDGGTLLFGCDFGILVNFGILVGVGIEQTSQETIDFSGVEAFFLAFPVHSELVHCDPKNYIRKHNRRGQNAYNPHRNKTTNISCR
jgi:hypothetical protein